MFLMLEVEETLKNILPCVLDVYDIKSHLRISLRTAYRLLELMEQRKLLFYDNSDRLVTRDDFINFLDEIQESGALAEQISLHKKNK